MARSEPGGDVWAEVNIGPDKRDGAERALLLDVVAPLVRDLIAQQVACWFFSWEGAPIGQRHLRSRAARKRRDGNAGLF